MAKDVSKKTVGKGKASANGKVAGGGPASKKRQTVALKVKRTIDSIPETDSPRKTGGLGLEAAGAALGRARHPGMTFGKAELTLDDITAYLPFPIFQDHIRNLFEPGRPGQPVVRTDDLVALRVEMKNLKIEAGDPPKLSKRGDGDAHLILHFPPQSFAEQTFFQPKQPDFEDQPLNAGDKPKPQPSMQGNFNPDSPTAPNGPPRPPVRARIANESRLSFVVPDGFEIDYTLEGVLAACRELAPKVAANAKPRPNPPPSFNLQEIITPPDISTMKLRQRVRLAGAVVNTVRIGALEGDISTVKARQYSIGGGLGAANLVPDFVREVWPFPRVKPKPGKPDAQTTSIEMPWRLILSPHDGAQWRHASGAVHSAATGRTELWHSQMITPDKKGKIVEPPYPDRKRTIRAIWALSGESREMASVPMQRDWPSAAQLPSTDTNPFRTTLDNFDRYQIVHLSSNFAAGNYVPQPIDTNLLMLSSLGGWLDSRGAWDTPLGMSVEEWGHRATMGRDHYVRVVYKGFLFPFGHRVSLIKISERKFHNGVSAPEYTPGNVAFLRQRMFIVIRERERAYDDSALFAVHDNLQDIFPARKFPFTKVKILTEVTPDLDDPAGQKSDAVGQKQKIFWPHVLNEPFRFQCAATDLDGRRVLFDLPMIFVDNTLAAPGSPGANGFTPDFATAENWASKVANAYANPPGANPKYNHAQLEGQRVALAPCLKSGDTSVMVETMTFGGFTQSGNQALQRWTNKLSRPLWIPQVEKANAQIGPIAQLSGQAGSHQLTFNNAYLKHGFENGPSQNRGEVFVDVGGSGPNLDFSKQGDKSGGFIQPNLKPAALSRFAGPVMSDPAAFIQGQMPVGAGFPLDPSDLPLPLIFGCIPLGAIIGGVTDVIGQADKVPKFVSEGSSEIEAFINGLVRLFDFVSDLAAQPSGIANAAMEVFVQTLNDIVEQAVAYAAVQVQPVVDAAGVLTVTLGDVAEKVTVLTELDLDQAIGAAELSSLPGAIATARNAVGGLRNAANASPGGVALPGGFRISALNAAQKIDAVLADMEQLQALLNSGKALWDSLFDIVGTPDTLATLIGSPALLRDKVEELAAAIDPFRTTLGDVRLMEGAPRSVLIEALDTVEQVLNGVGDLMNLVEMLAGDELTIRFDWNPEISSWGPSGGSSSPHPLFRVNNKRGLLVAVVAKIKKSGSAKPNISVTCSLKHFDLVLIAPASFIELNFEKIVFLVDSAAKMDVDVDLTDIKFVGPLSFVETLRDLIPLDGFADPPYLDITPQGIDAGFDVALPSITCGVLNIANVSLGAGFTVPFIGEPLSVRFNFCKRDQPFLLTVYIFGGGGFFGVTIDPSGVQILEAAFEFGAAFSIDFGVASGGVEVMAGIYYRMEGDEASLTGYFRLGGHVDVLGLITASIELYLELTYEFTTGKCIGRAELTIEISVFVFSGSVTIECERKFAGSNGDPTLRQMLGFAPELPLADELAQIDASTEYAWRDHFEAFA